jgi:hypothetical protein
MKSFESRRFFWVGRISWISYIKLFKIRRYQPPFKLCKKSSWLYGSWIYNYPCNQCLPPLTSTEVSNSSVQYKYIP